MLLGQQRHHRQDVSLLQAIREPRFGLLAFVVLALRIERRKAVKFEHRPGCPKFILARVDIHCGPIEHRRRHLTGDEPIPDQSIKLRLIGRQLCLNDLRKALRIRGAYRLVRILRPLSLPVGPFPGRQIRIPEPLPDIISRRR